MLFDIESDRGNENDMSQIIIQNDHSIEDPTPDKDTDCGSPVSNTPGILLSISNNGTSATKYG
jgi:hypothetical protein